MSQAHTPAETSGAVPSVAYLVIREGHGWRDVFRLVPGQVTTIGRAPTNRIVLRDEVCSRNHCEVFCSGTQWFVRDLGSRNGTIVGRDTIRGDHPLQNGQVILIGSTELGFTFDISQPFEAFGEGGEIESDTATDVSVVRPKKSPILDRRGTTRFQTQDADHREMSRLLSTLYRLGLQMAAARTSKSLCALVLETLCRETAANIGAILYLPSRPLPDEKAEPHELRVVAYQAAGDQPYHRVSDYLSGVVLSEREAILAHDVAADSKLSVRDSLDEIDVKSVICAPVRAADRLLGVIHLYSTEADSPVGPDDLEFTLAVADQLGTALENLREKESLARGLARARNQTENLLEQLALSSQLVGDSSAMQTLRETIRKIAPTDATVLIRGESGVGKELVARSIHFSSSRRDGPFVCMNCAALSESLLESELFGHEKGSFTGATDRKIGKFEQAHKGTLFLDEVGEMTEAIQAKFLRVLEGHHFERVGGHTAVQVDTRVVAATNRALEEAVQEGTFRKDLYFRLQVVELPVPPLREHPEDIPVLAEYFLERLLQKTSRPIQGFTSEALDVLTHYKWPGNIRELQNTVERTVILCSGDHIDKDDIRLSALSVSPEPSVASASGHYREISLETLEQEHILATLEQTKWNKSRAAQILGIERSTLDRKLKRYRVSRPQ